MHVLLWCFCIIVEASTYLLVILFHAVTVWFFKTQVVTVVLKWLSLLFRQGIRRIQENVCMHIHICSVKQGQEKAMCAKIYNSEAWHRRLDILLSSRPVWLQVNGVLQEAMEACLFTLLHGSSQESGVIPRTTIKASAYSCRTAHWGGGGLSGLMPWNSSAQLWRRWTWMSPFCLLKGLVLCSWPEALCLPQNVPFSTAGANGDPCG